MAPLSSTLAALLLLVACSLGIGIGNQGVANGPPPLTCPGAWESGVGVSGFELEAVPAVATRGQCCSLCRANPNCAAATHWRALRLCTLHANASATRPCTRSVVGGAAAAAAAETCASATVRGVVANQAGHFGRWSTDANGNPVYIYQCDQTRDPAALSPASPNPADRSSTEHVFQLGNSRITLVASNYGSFKLRQDEGGPKWLLGAADTPAGELAETGVPPSPPATQFGAGFGYLREVGPSGSGTPHDAGRILLSTYHTQAAGRRAREFGVGFARTNASSHDGGWVVAHTVAVPPGEDPVAVLEVRVTNTQAAERSAVWQEVVGARMVLQDYFATLALSHLDPFYHRLAERHQFSATHYNTTFAAGPGRTGLEVRRQWLGLSDRDEAVFNRIAKDSLPTAPNATWWDHNPPAAFLRPLEGSCTANGGAACKWGTDAKAFFGGGGVANPDGTVRFAASVDERGGAMLVQAPLKVKGGDTATLCFLVGYLPAKGSGAGAPNFTADGLAAKYSGACGGARADAAPDPASAFTPTSSASSATAATALFSSSAAAQAGGAHAGVAGQWTARLARLTVQHANADVGSELAWHSHYLQSGASFDDYFGEHIVDQGMSYRYTIGFQGAARDPVQHALGLLHTDPDLAKSVLLCTLKQMQPTLGRDTLRPTDLPYAMSGHGVKLAGLGLDIPIFGAAGKGNHPSDMELYVLLLAAEYVLATRDLLLLNITLPYYNSSREHTVLDALLGMLRFSTRTVGVGPHGLMRMLTSDWDDGLGPPDDDALNVSESVLNAALATYALPRFAEALRLVSWGGEAGEAAAEAEAFAAGQRRALLSDGAGWDNETRWLRRAWLGKGQGWAGGAATNASKHSGLFSPQHGFAFLGGAFGNQTTNTVAAAAAAAAAAAVPRGGDPVRAKLEASVAALTTKCRDGWPHGFAYHCDAQRDPVDSGAGPGMWPALDYPTAMGLAAVGFVDEAWEEFQRNSLHWQATVNPRQWSGIWTSADEVSINGGTGPVGTNYPAFCMHRHAWPLVAAAALAGAHFDRHGLVIRPSLPERLGATRWSSPRFSLAWDPSAQTYAGHYVVVTPAALRITVDLRQRMLRWRQHTGHAHASTTATITANVTTAAAGGSGPRLQAAVRRWLASGDAETVLQLDLGAAVQRVDFKVVLAQPGGPGPAEAAAAAMAREEGSRPASAG